MCAETHDQTADTLYEDILGRVARTRSHGTTRQRFNVDTWEPAVRAHSLSGPFIGDACSQCGEPWPCRLLLNLLNSGLVAEPGDLS